MHITAVRALLEETPYSVAEKDMLLDADRIIIGQPHPVRRVLAHRDELGAALGDDWAIETWTTPSKRKYVSIRLRRGKRG